MCGQQKLIRLVGVLEALGAMGQGSALKFGQFVMERTPSWQWVCMAIGVCVSDQQLLSSTLCPELAKLCLLLN